MKKLKDLCLSVLINEGEDVHSLSSADIKNIKDVEFDIGEDYIKFDFDTSYGKSFNLIVKISVFKTWVESNKDKANSLFRGFISDFIESSSETDEDLNEILDDDGINIIGDDGMPNNSTNSMVASPKFDLEKIYKKFVPKSIRFYSGDMGVGAITW